ncbi:Hypothetical_protein [Hexamita inflata]|uniref:Hypothetical_protein n=1 Tax=Hexamita inflata TaxID=28002 RepID=A0AA86REY6_9EUKA|nr:Hypothetical protein HINF_LOCUS59407 [Hexamita inflata]
MQIHIQDRNYYSSFIIDDELSDKDYVQKTNESFSEILKNNSLTKKQKINNSFDAQQLYKQANNINKNESESLANSTYNTQEQIDKLNSKIVDRDKKIFKQDADIKALNEKAEHKQLIYENNISKQKITYDIEIKALNEKILWQKLTYDIEIKALNEQATTNAQHKQLIKDIEIKALNEKIVYNQNLNLLQNQLTQIQTNSSLLLDISKKDDELKEIKQKLNEATAKVVKLETQQKYHQNSGQNNLEYIK